MKDLEKIKSEDLGCQVQDANPGNFAIEQEVAQLVGATVPAPTEPSADDARELGAQLLVFLRRALLPIRSALRTAVAAIYAHLDSRCTDYTPAAYAPYKPLPSYDPMRPFVPRTLPNLLTALTAFSARKISNGSAPSDGIPDGTSLARLLTDTTCQAAVVEIKDDVSGWTMDKELPIVAGLKRLTLRCRTISMPNYSTIFLRNPSELEELELPEMEDFFFVTGSYGNNLGLINNNAKLKKVRLPNWKRVCTSSGARGAQVDVFQNCTALEEIEAPNLHFIGCEYFVVGCTNLKRVQVGTLTAQWGNAYGSYENNFQQSTSNLEDFEIGAGTAISLNMSWWKPTNVLADADNTATFLLNFREHIALRLAQQPADNPNHLTLTLSQAVFDTIWNQDGTPKSTDPDSVIYQINKIIKTDKHWSVNRA